MPLTSVVDYRSHQMRDSRIERDGPEAEVGVGAGELPPGAAGLHLAGGLPLLRPAEQAFEAMLVSCLNRAEVCPVNVRHPPRCLTMVKQKRR